MDDIFNILDENQRNIKNTNVVSSNYKVDRNGMKKARMKKQIKFNKAKFIALGLGTVVICSGLRDLINSNDKNQINENNSSILIDISDDNVSHDNVEPDILVETVSKPKKTFKKADFEIGHDKDMQYIYDFMQTNRYGVIEEYSHQYGIDPQIMTAIGLKESSLNHESCLPNGNNYNGCAYGMLQIENVHIGETITAYNYETKEFDSIECTLENVTDYDKNIQIGCMMFQNSLEKYNGNLYLAIQAHNYGNNMMDIIIQKTADDMHINFDDILDNPFAIDWTDYLEDVYSNPLKYISSWEYQTYGNPNYLSDIINCCVSSDAHYIYNNKEFVFDLNSGHSQKYDIEKSKNY